MSQPGSEDLLKEEMDVARQLVQDFPAEAPALALLGTAYLMHGDSVEAVKCWEACLKLNPKFAPAYDRLGTNAIKKGEYEEAVRLYRKAVEVDPAMSGVHGGLGRALFYLGQPREAAAELEQETRISPQESLEYFLLGQAYLQLDDYEKARKNYEKAAQLRPNDSRAYYGLANACDKLGDGNQAQEYREKFRKLKAVESDAYYREVNGYDDLASLRQRVVLAHLSAGQVHRRSGGLQKAEEHWLRALALAPASTVCLGELAELYQGTGRAQDALEMCERLRAIEPGNVTCHFNIGVGNARLRRFDAAEEAFRKVVQLAPQRADGYRELARLFLSTGRKLDEARSLAQTAVRLEPSAANFCLLGQACDKNGDLPGALSAMERATALAPGNDQYRRIYGLLQQRK
ncbi:MAG: tetratricopeptide repeat protein [Thermoguttaceae bacterium]